MAWPLYRLSNANTRLLDEDSNSRTFVADGAGQFAGWLCIIREQGDWVSTGCSPRAAERGEDTSSFGLPGGQLLDVWAWVPDGYDTASAAGEQYCRSVPS